jgi:hypothetical protein
MVRQKLWVNDVKCLVAFLDAFFDKGQQNAVVLL